MPSTRRMNWVGLALLGALAGPMTPTLAVGGAFSGAVYDGCSSMTFTPVPIQASGGEYYFIKVARSASEDYTDWMFDLRPGRGQTPSADASGGENYITLAGNCTRAEAGSDVLFVIITFPDGRIALDSATLGLPDAGSAQVVSTQYVGSSLPLGELDGTGLTLAPLGYSVPSLVNRGAGPGTFPYGTRSAIEVAFAPLVELNNEDLAGGLGCSWGGAAPDPNLLPVRRGLIIGYNVYRMASPTEPTRAAIGVAANFQYLLRTDGFDYFTPDAAGATGADLNGDTLPDGDGADSPLDPMADGDLVGLVNPRVDPLYPETGDEVVIYSDAGRAPSGAPRGVGTAPLPGIRYWYAFQPVVRGTVAAFASVSIAKRPLADLRVDANLDGTYDGVNLDPNVDPTASVVEFSSPQADWGLPGLGLTNAGIPVLSQPVSGIMNPAAARDGGGVNVALVGQDLRISFAAGLETADILGYDIVRVIGDEHLPVNGRLVAARGGEGNIYEVTDSADWWTRLRARRSGLRPAYAVVVHHVDGTQGALVGPVELPPPSGDLARRARR